jgi:hypothetical protein
MGTGIFSTVIFDCVSVAAFTVLRYHNLPSKFPVLNRKPKHCLLKCLWALFTSLTQRGNNMILRNGFIYPKKLILKEMLKAEMVVFWTQNSTGSLS